MTTTIRGGPDPERVYLKDLAFTATSGKRVEVFTSSFPGADMLDTIARHRARYYLVGLFCRPSYLVLDFPCGSGYASEVLGPLGVGYRGFDNDAVTIEYAQLVYGGDHAEFGVGNLGDPQLPANAFDVVACIEGLEHIAIQHHDDLIHALATSLKRNGVLVISTPESSTGVSGRSSHNPYHLGELTRTDFVALLERHFPTDQIELITQRAPQLTTGVSATLLFGICKAFRA